MIAMDECERRRYAHTKHHQTPQLPSPTLRRRGRRGGPSHGSLGIARALLMPVLRISNRAWMNWIQQTYTIVGSKAGCLAALAQLHYLCTSGSGWTDNRTPHIKTVWVSRHVRVYFWVPCVGISCEGTNSDATWAQTNCEPCNLQPHKMYNMCKMSCDVCMHYGEIFLRTCVCVYQASQEGSFTIYTEAHLVPPTLRTCTSITTFKKPAWSDDAPPSPLLSFSVNVQSLCTLN